MSLQKWFTSPHESTINASQNQIKSSIPPSSIIITLRTKKERKKSVCVCERERVWEREKERNNFTYTDNCYLSSLLELVHQAVGVKKKNVWLWNSLAFLYFLLENISSGSKCSWNEGMNLDERWQVHKQRLMMSKYGLLQIKKTIHHDETALKPV